MENLSEQSIYNLNSEAIDESKGQPIYRMSASNSDDYLNQYHSVEHNVYASDYTQQANNENIPNYEAIGGKSVNYGDYYNYYANYYQNLNVKPDSSEIASQPIESHSNPRTVDLINKALAKQQLKALTDTRDDDEEEGQIPASPGCFNRSASRSPPIDSSRNSPYNTSHRSVSRSPSKGRSIRSHSRSRKRHGSRSRSRSPSRRRRRSRTRSRSRSPYYGPIIKDYRRGRRGFVRYPRGFRERGTRTFRRGHHSQFNYYGNSRRQEYSRSRSRSFSPKRRQIEIEKSDLNSDEEKTMDSKLSETLKPSDIKMSEKRLTQSFLAMLEEKQNRAKMIPVLHNSDNSENDSNKRHGFVNTFNSVQKSDRKHTLSYDLEREGWQVIDDANSDSKHNRNYKTIDDDDYDHKQRRAETSPGPEKSKELDIDSDSSDSGNKNKKSSKKSKKQKKKKKRKSSTSTDSSDSESDNENKDEIETKPKKRSKKKKRKSKKKKKKKSSSSSSSSENEELNKKQKRKKKSKDSSSESQSEDKPEETESSVFNQKTTETANSLENSSVVSDVSKDNVKNKDKKRSKRKSSDSDSSDSDSDDDNKKKKKKKKRKTSKKRKHRSSSSSSSDSSDSSESVDRKKKKKKKSKKNKTKKHKKRSEKKEKSKTNNEKKKVKEEDEEFVSVTAVGEEPLEIKWPKKLIKFTHCLPSLQYSVNPKVVINSDDFKGDQQIGVNQQIDVKESHKLVTEYERFIGELNPNQENQPISEDPNVLETKLRDKLVKHFYDRNEFQKTDSMTSSERRAYEKTKKHGFHSYEPNDEHKAHEDLKSAPLTAYYSPKVQKTSPNHKTDETNENIELKINKTHELDHQNRISLTVEESKDGSTHKLELKVNESSKTEDRKKTAKELLERIKQKKHSDKDYKETTIKDKTDSKSSKKLPQIGKMKIPPKKSLSKKFVTTATADSTQNSFVSQPMKLDMNYDYNWYYNYYLNSVYGVAQYPQMVDPALASAYYAHYSMLTSYDYNQTDLNSWMTQKGFTFDSTSAITESQTDVKSSEQKTETQLKTEETLTSVESSVVNPNDSNNCSENVVKESINEQTSDLKTVNTETEEQKTIEVLISSTNSELPIEDSTEPKCSPQMSPFSSSVFQHKVKVRVTADSHNQIESTFEANDDAVGAPPPPPPRPMMTSFTSTEPVTLPNGVELPVGTKQIVVHPYRTDDSYKYTAEWFGEAFSAQNSTTQTNSS